MTSGTGLVAGQTIIDRLKWRYATKQFDPNRIISKEDWKILEQALILSPSSYGIQPWKFIVITNKELRQKLRGFAWNQAQITDASHLIVLAAKKKIEVADVDKLIEATAKARQVTIDKLDGYKNMMIGSLVNATFDITVWTKHQVYIALGELMTSAAMMGIDVCPMEGFDSVRFDEALNLGQLGYTAAVLAPAGYRHSDDRYASTPKVRYSADEIMLYID